MDRRLLLGRLAAVRERLVSAQSRTDTPHSLNLIGKWVGEALYLTDRLVEDLKAEGELAARTAPGLVLVRVLALNVGKAVRWDGWDASGAQYRLRYRAGEGVVLRVREEGGRRVADEGQPVVRFVYGGKHDSTISLGEFAKLAGIAVQVGGAR